MNIVDLLVTIVVVTILVTIILAIVTYVAYKLRLSREPSTAVEPAGPQYFVPYPPPERSPDEGTALASDASDRLPSGKADASQA